MNQEYITLDAAAKQLGMKKGSLYYYFRELGIKQKKFKGNKLVYLTNADVEHIRAVREEPWTVEEEGTHHENCTVSQQP